ncbi:MAG: phosphoribosylamine--glycine ligase [Clostridiales bacterium]|jgi:phosphoribosylamine--glycine ligase|nr:phosphoribosylamine--glycine ligase [Clostridiales bacterium]
MLNIAVLVSGGGTNLQAVIDAVESGALNVNIKIVLSSNNSAYALTRAKDHGIPTRVMIRKQFAGRDAFDKTMIATLKEHDIHLVVLAGYLPILSPAVVEAYRGRIINIHPALLPRHGGKGMHGLRVHEAVLAAGDTITGATVHYVDEGTDTGHIILQKTVDVLPEDTPEILQKRVLENAEHIILSQAIDLVSKRISTRKVLIVGSGGREHAIAWKIHKDDPAVELYVAPGNAGTAQIATNVEIKINDLGGLVKFAKAHEIDLTVVGPEEPLTLGLADAFLASGLKVFGCNAAAARFEGSKSYAKQFMIKHHLPTAGCGVFAADGECEEAREYVAAANLPLVIKLDGLAAGKGVAVCFSRAEAREALDNAITLGGTFIIEEYLDGEEVSVLAFLDGEGHYKVMPLSQDHKRAYDNDEGPNTGGMGAYSPKILSERVYSQCENIVRDTALSFVSDGIIFKGVLFVGLMLTDDGAKILEYNARFGDPETQSVLPRINNKLLDIMIACEDGQLENVALDISPKTTACIVIASGGYPYAYQKGFVIDGLYKNEEPDIIIFHAGTRLDGDRVVTDGGRVLGVCGIGESVAEALESAGRSVNNIVFEGAQYRTDIGKRARLYDL